jgi:hypothetical protein
LTVRIESVGPAATNFTVGAVVAFAIHSPSLLFGEEAKKGKTYEFSVQREIKHGKTRYFGLKVEKVQTAPVVSSARHAKPDMCHGQVFEVNCTSTSTAFTRRGTNSPVVLGRLWHEMLKTGRSIASLPLF